ncbi:MAG: four helix bundle protein [Microgenomates group bacterium]
MKITKIEDFEIWKEAVELVILVYQVIKKTNLKNDFVLNDQIKKSVISIPSNIAEGFERSNNTEFKRFLIIAKGSSGELRVQFYLAFKLNLIDEVNYRLINDKIIRLSSKISNLISYLRKNKK